MGVRVVFGFLLEIYTSWAFTMEDILDAPKRLTKACKKLNIEDGVFTTCSIGETLLFKATSVIPGRKVQTTQYFQQPAYHRFMVSQGSFRCTFGHFNFLESRE